MRVIFVIISLFVALMPLCAQRPTKSSPVSIMVGDSAYQIAPQHTQTELKPGWKIVDIKLRDKTTRYLWGSSARQLADSPMLTFVIDTGGHALTDFSIIRLKQKRDYRRFPKAVFTQCDRIVLDLEAAEVRLLPDERFRVQLRQALPPGEYVVVDLKADPVNDSGDMPVYPFCVKR